MILPSKLLGTLKKDHDILRECLFVLKDESADLDLLQKAFSKLIPFLQAHNRSEEQVVYKFMLSRQGLEQMAIDGQEEHLVVEQLMNELQTQASECDVKWRAKAKAFAEIIEQHVNEEESQVFPILKKQLISEFDEYLCHKYELINMEYKSKAVVRRSEFEWANAYSVH